MRGDGAGLVVGQDEKDRYEVLGGEGVGRLDEPFLKEDPKGFGGKLAFENPGVRIYAFE